MAILSTRGRRRPIRHGGFSGWLLALALLWAAPGGVGAPTTPSESQIKAVFLYNFVRFVDWPPQAFPESQTPVVIGVLGEDPFGAALDEAIRGETVAGRSLTVRRFRRVEEIELCHVLFIGRTENARLGPILAALKDRSVLTVSDAEDFTRRGGMIRFLTENNKVRLRINVEAARAAGLMISSKLLRPAEIVTTTKG